MLSRHFFKNLDSKFEMCEGVQKLNLPKNISNRSVLNLIKICSIGMDMKHRIQPTLRAFTYLTRRTAENRRTILEQIVNASLQPGCSE